MRTLLLVLVGCGAWEEERTALVEEAQRAEMEEHWLAATAARDAVFSGDLVGVHAAAGRLAEAAAWGRTPPSLAGLAPPMVEAAREMAAAEDLTSASRALGGMALGCGACHAVAGAEIGAEAPPAGGGDELQRLMSHHRRASDLLWLGLTLNDDAAVAAAVDELTARSVLAEGAIAGRFPDSGLARGLEERVFEQVAAVRDAEPAARGEAYAELLVICATCHLLSGDGPRPGVGAEPAEAAGAGSSAAPPSPGGGAAR